jgi:protein gp37
MSDLFHEDVPFEFIDRVFDVMERASWHTFQVLTKRPERMVEFFGGTSGTGLSAPALPNVWLGTSVENQAADERIPHLLECPAAVKFLSIEPLLGPLDLTSIDTHRTWPGKGETSKINALQGYASSRRERFVLNGIVEESGNGCRFVDRQFSGKIDWVIVGGESGPGARPMETDWVRAIRDQCVEAKVPFFFKQWGTAKWVSAKWVDMRQDDGGLPVLDGRTWAEMPG